jgi:large repetitive protein
VGKTYLWFPVVGDGVVNYNGQVYSFRVEAPQPPITSHLSQNSENNGLDASIGNYTTSATDANVATAGPALSIARDYNSKDPRVTGGFGASWSSVLDARAVEHQDLNSSLVYVTVTYPDGQQVAFGRKADGTFTAPLGRYATLKSVAGGYTLTDKNQTVYTFGQVLNTGCSSPNCQYGITKITDPNSRSITFGYTSGQIVSVTSSVSGRVLHVTWSTPTGATVAHVATVYTDAAVTGDSSTVQTWTYTYTGDQLTKVCPPTSATACSTYGYQSASRYPNTVLDLGPRSYWRFAESSGTVASSQVLANNGADAVTYRNVTLGAAGPLPGSSATAGSFNGTSSLVDLTQGGNPAKQVFNDLLPMTTSMWFKTTGTNEVLLSYVQDPVVNNSSTTSNGFAPALYIGASGKLHAQYWIPAGATPIVTSSAVNDGQWHHVVLAYGNNSQTLYLDNTTVGTLTGTVDAGGFPYQYIGSGFLGSTWPDQTLGTPAHAAYFNGTLSDVAFYTSALDSSSATALYNAGHAAGQLMSSVTRPSGNAAASLTYDSVSGRVASLTDANGGSWTMGTPGVAGSSQVFADSVLGGSPQAYWRLNDTTGTVARDQVKGGDGTYSGVTLNQGSPFSDGTPGASFDGASSYLSLPNNLINGTKDMSVSMWFKSTDALAPLLSYSQDPITAGTTGAAYVPTLYIGLSGKLHAEFWAPSGVTPIVTSTAVNDNNWHYVVLTYSQAGTGTQALYVDGKQVGIVTGAVDADGFLNDYVGAGFVGGSWPDSGGGTGTADFFGGNITDVAYYRYQITQQMVDAQYAASRTANTLISDGGATPVETVNVTDPGGKTIGYSYDPNMGNRLLSRTDGLGNTTRYGYDSNGFLNTVTDPNGAATTTGHDVRGNAVSKTSCQNQATNSCSTTYYTYYPDDTSATPAADPRNDVVLTVRDGRSSDGNDNTYKTSYGYDTLGNRTTATTPAVSGFPSGRVTTTVYADGTGTYPATGGGSVPAGLPVKVTTPGGAVTTTAYFSNGDVASVTDPVSLVTSYTYDNLGRALTEKVVSDTYPAGLTTTVVYDKLNRPTTETDPAVTNRVTGAVHTKKITSVYDDDGNATSQTVQDLTGGDATRTTSATFNSHDQQITTTDGASKTTTYGYDGYGNKNKMVDPANVETDYAFDANGHLLTTTLKGWTGDPVSPSAPADLVRESRAYDPAGRLASVTDSMGWVTSYTYTDNGLTATITRSDPAHPGTSFVLESDSYDAASNPTSKVANNGVTTTDATVDAANRTTQSVVDPTGVNRTTTYAYSPDDAVLSTRVSATSGATTTDATYDLGGRMTSQTVENNLTGNSPSGWWKLSETGGTVASDSSGAGQTGTLASGVTWTPGGVSSATFNGTTGTITTNGPVLNTAADFSVSAWVNITTLSGFPVAVSQDATHNAGFYLEYSSSLGKWAFTRTPDDTNAGGSLYAASTNAATANTWVHLVGTYQQSNGKLTLYVNGSVQNTTGTDSTPFNATGPLTIGRAKYTSNNGQYWPGQISNVQVYPRVLSAADVSTLYGNTRTGAALATNQLTTTRSLDRRGLAKTSTDPKGNITSYTYDEAGKLAITTAPTVNTETGGGTPVSTNPAVSTGYDTFGAKTQAEDANGNTTTTGYDADGRPTSLTMPSYTPPGGTAIIPVAHRTYNNQGLVDTATDPAGNQTSYVYDQMGRTAKVTAPNLGVTHTTYDTEGDILSVSDPNGAVNQATYDYLGRKATTTQVVRQPSTNSYTTSYAYTTPGGWLTSVTTPGSVATTYAYDHVGETTTVTDAASNVTGYTYDYAGQKTKTTLPDNTAITATFDAAGRQTGAAKLDTNGTTVLASTSAVYDSDGNATSTTDTLGHATVFTFDATNRLSTEVQPISASASITTSFGYDPVGHRTRFTDGRSNAFITTYNTLGLPESQIEPSTTAYPNLVDRTFTTAYDANGRVALQTSPGGVTVTNTYDTLNDLTGQSGSGADAATTARTFGYDTGGRMTSASAPGGTDTFTLDDRGLLLSTSGPSGSSSFAYNGDGLMTTRADAAGTSSYTYDTVDRLKTITDASTAAVLTYSYNTLSQRSGITYGAGADTRAFGYDHLHRLTSDALKTNAGSTIASISYGYDTNNNETTKNTVGFSGASNNTYTYDWANRLLSWNNGTGTSNYAYDNSGNRTQAGVQTFAYNARNQITTGAGSTYNYTARGTLTSVVTGGTTVNTTNDAFGQAITQGTQTYVYDAFGRAVTDTTSGGGTRTFAYTGTGNTVAGDGTSTYSRDPGGGLVGTKTGASGVLAWTDQHTDLVGQFATTGTSLAGSTTYGPLGTIAATAGMTGNLGYQSAFTELNTGRVNMAARWYNPNSGQFDNRDTANNNPTPNEADANRYAYADDDPLTGTDPTGHFRYGCADGWCPDQPHPAAPPPPPPPLVRRPAGVHKDPVNNHPVNAGIVTVFLPPAPPVSYGPSNNGINDGQSNWCANPGGGCKASSAVPVLSTRFPNGTVVDQYADGSVYINGYLLPDGHPDPMLLGQKIDDNMNGPGATGANEGGLKRIAVTQAMIVGACQKFDLDGCFNKRGSVGHNWADRVAHDLLLTNWLLKQDPQGTHQLSKDAVAAGGLMAAGIYTLPDLILIGVNAALSCMDPPGMYNTGPGGRDSFDPATPVLMANGTTRPIKNIKIGDQVAATNPTTGQTTAQPVTQLHQHIDTDLTDLALAPTPATLRELVEPAAVTTGKTTILHTTAHHPFWDATTHQWVPAGALTPGHRLLGPEGQTLHVTAVHNYVGAKDMRNLTVADMHTYYVVAGSTPVLVHNCGGDGWASQAHLDDHFAAHGQDMGFETQIEYENAAIDLTCTCDGVRNGVLRKLDSTTGKTYFFDPANSEFAITDSRGIITFYKLDGGITSFNGMPGELIQ